MFRLGAFTDEISTDLAKACRVMNEFGVEGAELRKVWDTVAQNFTPAQVQDAKRILDDHNVVVCSMGTNFGKCDLDDPAQLKEHLDILRRAADVGLELGCTLIRGFAFWDHNQVAEKPWDAMLKAYEPVPKILEEKGVILGLENEAACYVGTARHLRYFLDRLGCSRVKAVWDPTNHIQDPQSDDCPPYPDGYELVKKDIVHIHVKDAKVEPDGSRPNVFLGEGLADWKGHLAALRRDNYKGFLSLETHVNPERIPPSLLAKYGKFMQGEGREPASRVCLAWLRDAVAEILNA